MKRTILPIITQAKQLPDIKDRALRVVRSNFGKADVWSSAVEALFSKLESRDGSELIHADLDDIEKSLGISVANILFPILNLLSADDIGILHREFNREDVSKGATLLTFDEIRLSALETNGDDWANNISVRWCVAAVQPVLVGGIYGH